MAHIPVVDFSAYGVGCDVSSVDQEKLQELVSRVHDAFSSIGFVYLKNHGIPQHLIDQANDTVERFFALPVDVKSKYARPGDSNHGWVQLETESLNPERPGDLKEAFNITVVNAKSWPDAEVPCFQSNLLSLYDKCTELTHRVLDVMAMGLDLPDKQFFRKCHNIDSSPSMTTMRMLYYPPVNEYKLKSGQVRCGEHSDYGSITLLFQDDIGGLEVASRTGEYIPATPIPGTVIVNIGDLMQRWTADRLVSTKHRVLIPDSALQLTTPRKSLAYFVHPDDDVMITCIDGSNKYEPIKSLDYTKQRFKATY